MHLIEFVNGMNDQPLFINPDKISIVQKSSLDEKETEILLINGTWVVLKHTLEEVVSKIKILG